MRECLRSRSNEEIMKLCGDTNLKFKRIPIHISKIPNSKSSPTPPPRKKNREKTRTKKALCSQLLGLELILVGMILLSWLNYLLLTNVEPTQLTNTCFHQNATTYFVQSTWMLLSLSLSCCCCCCCMGFDFLFSIIFFVSLLFLRHGGSVNLPAVLPYYSHAPPVRSMLGIDRNLLWYIDHLLSTYRFFLKNILTYCSATLWSTVDFFVLLI